MRRPQKTKTLNRLGWRRINGTYATLWQHQSGGFLDDDTMTAMLPEAPRLRA